jgi:hypothetical protein
MRLLMKVDDAERPLIPEIAREIDRGILVEGAVPSVPLEP